MPCASRNDGRTATVRSAVRAETSSRRPVNTTRPATGSPREAARARNASASEPSPTMASQRRWQPPRGSRAWPRSGSGGPSPAPGARRRRAAERRAECRTRGRSAHVGAGTCEAREVDAVGDDGESGAAPRPSARDLAANAVGRHDQPIHRRRERREQRDVLGRADARRVDGGHDHRRPGRDRRARAEHLGAVHVGVDEIDLLAPQPGRELADGELVIGLVEDVDRDAQPLQALDRRAGREGEGADLVAGSVQAQEQPGVALLGAAVAAGRQQLEDPRPRMAPGPMDPPMPRVRRAGDGALVVGRARPPVADGGSRTRCYGWPLYESKRPLGPSETMYAHAAWRSRDSCSPVGAERGCSRSRWSRTSICCRSSIGR